MSPYILRERLEGRAITKSGIRSDHSFDRIARLKSEAIALDRGGEERSQESTSKADRPIKRCFRPGMMSIITNLQPTHDYSQR